jgi:hypothetical protein
MWTLFLIYTEVPMLLSHDTSVLTNLLIVWQQRLLAIQGCLRHLATKPEDARRRSPSDEDDDGYLSGLFDPFEIDVSAKLLPSRALRRLASHAQVVPNPPNQHIRTRRSHSDEVASIAQLIAGLLGLNSRLCFAGALGHDLGHTPYGHVGENSLQQITGQNFRHEVFGCVVAQHLERSGRGLNLTKQTLEIMLRHSRGAGDLQNEALTAEQAVVMYADKIAYLFAEYNDFRRLLSNGQVYLSESRIRTIHDSMSKLGNSQRERVARCVVALCEESAQCGRVSFSQGETFELFEAARRAMYAFYPSNNPSRHGYSILEAVYRALPDLLPEIDPTLAFALLCDSDVVRLSEVIRDRALSAGEPVLSTLSIADMLPWLRSKRLNCFDPDLDWPGFPD